MPVPSIRRDGIEKTVNDYSERRGIPYRFKDLSDWYYKGIHGKKVTIEWIRERWAPEGGKPISQPTFYKWIDRLIEEKGPRG